MTESSPPSAGTERLSPEKIEKLLALLDNKDAETMHAIGHLLEPNEKSLYWLAADTIRALQSRRSSPAATKDSGRIQAGDPTRGAEQGGAAAYTKADMDAALGALFTALQFLRDPPPPSTEGARLRAATTIYGYMSRKNVITLGDSVVEKYWPTTAEGLSAGGEQGLPKAASPEVVRALPDDRSKQDVANLVDLAVSDSFVGFGNDAHYDYDILVQKLRVNGLAIVALSPPQGGAAAKE